MEYNAAVRHLEDKKRSGALLDGSLPAEEIFPLIDISFLLTLGKKEAFK